MPLDSEASTVDDPRGEIPKDRREANLDAGTIAYIAGISSNFGTGSRTSVKDLLTISAVGAVLHLQCCFQVTGKSETIGLKMRERETTSTSFGSVVVRGSPADQRGFAFGLSAGI